MLLSFNVDHTDFLFRGHRALAHELYAKELLELPKANRLKAEWSFEIQVTQIARGIAKKIKQTGEFIDEGVEYSEPMSAFLEWMSSQMYKGGRQVYQAVSAEVIGKVIRREIDFNTFLHLAIPQDVRPNTIISSSFNKHKKGGRLVKK